MPQTNIYIIYKHLDFDLDRNQEVPNIVGL